MLQKCHDDDNDDILSAFVPMPEELRRIITGFGTMSDGTRAERWIENPDGTTVALTPERSQELKDKYGTDNWYDWAVANWGTKWDTSHPSIDFHGDGKHVTVLFDSAWSPPVAWFEKVVAQHPEGVTSMAYSEGGMAYFGYMEYSDGEVVERWESNAFWKQNDDEEPDDPMDSLTSVCRDHIERHGLNIGG